MKGSSTTEDGGVFLMGRHVVELYSCISLCPKPPLGDFISSSKARRVGNNAALGGNENK